MAHFGEAVIEGLNGEADVKGNNDGIVTIQELNDYLTFRVIQLTEGKQVR